MSSQPLRWGLLSTARINRSLIHPLRSSKRNQLVAVASRSQEKAEAYAREWQISRAIGSYEALISDPEIDVVYNSLPNHLHAEWTIKALHAGKHVLCEKPLALSLEDVDAMSTAAHETENVLAEAFMYRHHPQTLKVKELIKSGTLGKLQVIHGSFTFVLTREGNFRFFKEMGGGSIWDIGCYPISYTRTMIGAEANEVFGWQVTGPGGGDTTFVGQMRFPGEVMAQFDSSFASPFGAQMEIIGSEASLLIPNPFKPSRKEKIFLKRGDKTETIKIAGQELYSGEVEDIADAILLGKPLRVSLEDSRGNIATILALLESAKINQPVSL